MQLKQQEELRDTEQTISNLDTEIAELRKKMWPSREASPRIQPMSEEMSSASEDDGSSDDLSRGLGRWYEVVKPEKGGLKNW